MSRWQRIETFLARVEEPDVVVSLCCLVALAVAGLVYQ